MTLAEFKAWFDGFTEDMDGQPNKKQWERIKARVKEINGSVTTYPVYVDRYVRPFWSSPSVYGGGAVGGAVTAVGLKSDYHAETALHSVGKAEFNKTVLAA